MATLVLTTLGTVLGGPIGGAIGALAGQAIDTRIFRPKGRTGPRLTDLNVQTSRYGASVPRIYGRMRVAGTVIWATDLAESSATTRGGKGQPSITSYTYSASLAVALSSRPVIGIGRIWADGNLLRGSAGDFKAPLGALRLYHGGGGQEADPLIAAAVGAGQAPAFRGLAYVVLEALQLADFGNRIPSLTAELIADEGAVTISAIAADLLGRPVAWMGGGEPAVLGYAADGENAGDALAPLIEAHRLRWRTGGGEVALAERVGTGRTLARGAEVRAVDGREEAAGDMRRRPVEDLPAQLAVRHFDPARDYQIGVQSALRPGPGRRLEELGLPAAISADAARTLADEALRAGLAGRRTVTRATGWAALDLAPGDMLAIEGEPGAWLLDRLEWENMAPRLTLQAVASGAVVPAAGDSGQPLLPPDLVQGETLLALVELPPPDDGLAQAPLIFAAATGATAGWRRAALFHYRAATETAEPAGRTAPRAVLGEALDALAPGAPWRFDGSSSVEIRLDNDADALLDADRAELLCHANLCMLGEELLQFGRAEPVGTGRYRLSRLLRGWRGTEWAMAGHVAGERFVLLDAARLVPVTTTPADIGQWLEMRASGPGDTVPAQAGRLVDGRAILPPSPVRPVLREGGGGDLHVGWTRRSRLGWLWRDLADAPLGEEREAYAVTVLAGAAALRTVETASAGWTYAAGDRAADLLAAGGAPLRLHVRQIGTFGPGRALEIPLD